MRFKIVMAILTLDLGYLKKIVDFGQNLPAASNANGVAANDNYLKSDFGLNLAGCGIDYA